ncbi:MAG: acetyl-CoA acetyltransferase, partial [Pseudomonadota bacterium]
SKYIRMAKPMSTDARRPSIVGVGQIEQRVQDPLTGMEPLEMMLAALEKAADDAGNRDLLKNTQSVRVVKGLWRYENPAKVIAERLGVPNAQTVGTPYGGNMVQHTVSQTALSIQNGELDIAVITGAEHGYSQAKARKAGTKLSYAPAPGEPDLTLSEDKPMMHEAEQARNIRQPIQMYPIFENAIRYARGESIEEHITRVSELWAGFNSVAVSNPNAWIRDAISAEEIRTPSSSNRIVSFPYPKLMNSNNNVDQGAAIIMCSVETARRMNIPEERWAYPHAGTDAHDTMATSHRDNLHSSPAIRIAGKQVLDLAKVTLDDISHLDIYSCFPSAVQVAMKELEVPEDRPVTVTGGLTFGGGPLNNYVMHSIARTVDLVRENPGTKGLVTANGGFLTKHAFGVYSTEPPADGFQYADCQAEVEKMPRREAVVDHEGKATIESYTVMYGPEGPAVGHAACLLDDGRRTWANISDKDVVQAMTQEEFCGRAVTIDGQGNFAVA